MRGCTVSIRPLQRYEPLAQGTAQLPVVIEWMQALSPTAVKTRLSKHAACIGVDTALIFKQSCLRTDARSAIKCT
jgi:hypothetical protein